MTTDYKDTVFLPETAFPMRGNLPQREPEILAAWAAQDLDTQLLHHNAGAEKYILHDGPPYANGHLHIGHALNKILKDVICRHQRMLGKHVPYVPGWDCHGLPIEWKIEEKYRAAKQNKDDVPVLQFRQECRDYAAHWIDIQRGEFQRLGVSGDWQNPYTTMTFAAEAQIVRELHTFLKNGTLYQGFKPVLWSVVEQTALAEAEVEYQEKESTEAYVLFKVNQVSTCGDPIDTNGFPLSIAEMQNCFIVAWTTTPWTLPANAAIAYNSKIEYCILSHKGKNYIVAANLAKSFANKCGFDDSFKVLKKFFLSENNFNENSLQIYSVEPIFEDMRADNLRRAYHADFVGEDKGTGFVHIAPAHGEDDFSLFLKFPKTLGSFPQIVNKDGTYKSSVQHFAGMHIFKESTTEAILNLLREKGALLHVNKFKHSYPHSWRSKKPLIYLATPQWFIGLDKSASLRAAAKQSSADIASKPRPDETGDTDRLSVTGLAQPLDCFAAARNDDAATIRQIAQDSLADTRFYPPQGQNRLRTMIENRPDWCVSRQRVWGVPIMLLVHKDTGQPLKDPVVLDRIAALVETRGCDVWFDDAVIAEVLAGTEYKPEDYTRVTDILDVWFDSGSTHAFVLEQRPELRKPADQRPADLYLEGSDQHRGWFQSSLLESCGTRGQAPYDAVLTHGFVLDEQGRKMSKSLGNVVAPQDVIAKYGADILRLWVVSSDYYGDLRIGPAILEHHADLYRRLRNTLRYLLGSLKDFSPAEEINDPAALPPLEQAVLHRLTELDQLVRKAQHDYSFHALYSEMHQFCAVDLSAFYFDIRKDALYCDGADSVRRQATRTVMRQVLSCLTAWLAPVLCFTAEDAWQAGRVLLTDGEGDASSVHLRPMPVVPASWQNPAVALLWQQVRQVRRVVLAALERARAERKIGASLQAAPEVYIVDEYARALQGLDLAEICITSGVTVRPFANAPADAFALPDVPGVSVVAALALGEKCARCWQVLPEVGTHTAHPALCTRCVDVITTAEAVP